jgi:L-ascorbate metabolism protein UlaG (beta-lactamase superfamily)
MSMRVGKLLLLLLLLLVGIPSCSWLNPPPFDEAQWRRQVESSRADLIHAPQVRDDGRYFNPWMDIQHGGLMRFLQWRLSSGGTYTSEEETFRPNVVPGLRAKIEAMPAGDFVAWIGHGSFILRLNGAYWLLDPMLSKRALLPKRLTPPALTIDELGGMAGPFHVVVSHNHYDHLDRATLEALPSASRVYVPLGLGDFVREVSGKEVTEMDWWQTVEIGNGVRLVCLPAQHWSRRIGQARNSTLWASFLLITPARTLYFGGDSGYFTGYREIGRRYPGIDTALLPITAYDPRWFMHYSHMNAEEALDALEDLGAHSLIPTQWGTFRLGNEPIGHPIVSLRRVMKERGFNESRVLIMDIGQLTRLPESR